MAVALIVDFPADFNYDYADDTEEPI